MGFQLPSRIGDLIELPNRTELNTRWPEVLWALRDDVKSGYLVDADKQFGESQLLGHFGDDFDVVCSKMRVVGERLTDHFGAKDQASTEELVSASLWRYVLEGNERYEIRSGEIEFEEFVWTDLNLDRSEPVATIGSALNPIRTKIDRRLGFAQFPTADKAPKNVEAVLKTLVELVLEQPSATAPSAGGSPAGSATDEEIKDALLTLLPKPVAFSMHEWSDARPEDHPPIDEENFAPFVPDLHRRAIPELADLLASGTNAGASGEAGRILLAGPPGSGKTRIGHIAAVAAAHLHPRNAVILMPTRATVRENYLGLEELTSADEREWKIAAGSMEDRIHDDLLAAGSFDIAVLVYERMENLIARNKRTLKNAGLIVVDETHYIGKDQRGARLEGLISMIRVLRPDVPMLLISATMSDQSQASVASWLGGAKVIATRQRPVAQSVHCLNDSVKLTTEYPKDQEPVNIEELPAEDAFELSGDLVLPRKYKRIQRSTAIRLVCKLLIDGEKSGSLPRIICFAGERNRAQDIAWAIRSVMDSASPLERRGPTAMEQILGQGEAENPWETGRFAKSANLPGAMRAERFKSLMATDDHRWQREVLEGVRTGVAFHSRSLQSVLRRSLEEEFRDGVVRVLVSTDTLSEGINLPATDVVNFDLRRAREPIPVDVLKNRIGRAGRLGLGEAGNAWIVAVPGRGDAWETVPLEIWRTWVSKAAEIPPLESQLDLDAQCDLVLQYLISDRVPAKNWAREELVGVAGEILDKTFRAHLAAPAERGSMAETVVTALEPRQVVAELEDQDLVGSPYGQDRFSVTPLGMAIARRALPIGSAQTVQRIVELANSNCATPSLLFVAAQDERVTETVKGKWLSWRAGAKPQAVQSLLLGVVTYTRYHAGLEENRLAASKTGFIDAAMISYPDDLAPTFAQPLTEYCESHSEVDLPTDETEEDHARNVAAFRACVASDWSRFTPFEKIEHRIGHLKITYPDGQSIEIPWAIPDIETLGEQCAFLIAAASEASDLGSGQRLRLRELSERLVSGLPKVLTLLRQTELPGLGREKLLRAHRDAAGFESVDDIVEQLELAAPDRAELDRYLAAFNAQRDQRFTVFPFSDEEGKLEFGTAPLSVYWEAITTTKTSASEKLKAVHSLLSNTGVDAEIVDERIRVAGSEEFVLDVDGGDWDRSRIDALLQESRENAGIADRLVLHLRPLDVGPQEQFDLEQEAWATNDTNVSFVEPAAFIAFVKEIRLRVGAAAVAEEIPEVISRYFTRSLAGERRLFTLSEMGSFLDSIEAQAPRD